MCFQSQLGSIGAGHRCSRGQRYCPLSIPAWFDWRNFCLDSLKVGQEPFNPSLVRLAHVDRTRADTRAFIFQSQLGSIGA